MAGAAVVGAGISIYSSIKQGQAQSDQALVNARYAALQGADARDRGEYAAGLTEIQGGKLASEARAAFGASGVDATVGTPADAQASSRMMSQVDAQTQRNNAAREALGYQLQSNQFQTQAALDTQRATLGAVGTTLGTVGTLASQYGQWKASQDPVTGGSKLSVGLNSSTRSLKIPKAGY